MREEPKVYDFMLSHFFFYVFFFHYVYCLIVTLKRGSWQLGLHVTHLHMPPCILLSIGFSYITHLLIIYTFSIFLFFFKN